MTDEPSHDGHPCLDDGAYVLGALSPEERSAFEAHLSGCPDCARSVAELAGLPELLGRVRPEVALALDDGPGWDEQSVPPPLLGAVGGESRRPHRRQRWRTAAGLVAAAAGLIVVVGVAGAVLDDDETPPPTALQTEVLELEPVRDTPLAVTARLRDVAWGTSLEFICRYDSDSTGRAYELLLVDTQGNVEELGSWVAVPGQVISVPGATALSRSDISSIEVRSPRGTPLLRAPA